MKFVKVAEISEIPASKMKKVNIEGKEILIVNVDGNYYAIGNRCMHAGGDLSKGSSEGKIVTCPRHKAKFDVTTGDVVSNPTIIMFGVVSPLKPKIQKEPVYEVKVEGKDILLKID